MTTYGRHVRRRALGVVLIATLAVAGVAVAPGTGGRKAFAASGPPTITPVAANAGSHGYPYDAATTIATFPGAATLDLASYGYAEREFTMSGTTNIYSQSGIWGSDGRWNVSISQSNVPYKTRLLVRYPTNPAKFNGTVVVEWLNDTTGGDQDPVWSEIYRQALTDGYAYVGVTAQTPGMNELKSWDSQRYGSLGDSNDGQSYDIFTQAAQVARSNGATLFGGLNPTRVIGIGDSQSAFRLDTYVNAIQPRTHAFNAFMAVGRAAVAAPIGSGLIMLLPFPVNIRTDNTTPFMQLNMEGDLEEFADTLARQADNTYLRTWELPGAAHIDLHEGLYEGNTILRENPQLTAPKCVAGVVANNATLPDDMPVYELEDAALSALQKWLVQGISAPHGSQVSTSFFFNPVNRDQYGNALGGIRLPEIQAPTQTFSAINFSAPTQESLSLTGIETTLFSIFNTLETGAITDTTLRNEGLCLLEGYYTPFSSTTLHSLYSSHSDYVSKYTAAALAAYSSGFLTLQDAFLSVVAAQGASIP
jgi:hypothetical protein